MNEYPYLSVPLVEERILSEEGDTFSSPHTDVVS